MEKYEDKIYSLGEAVTGQTQAMSQAVQKTLYGLHLERYGSKP